MDRWDRAGTQLALLADDDRETARFARPWLLSHGLELVHARAAVAALELLQRMPESFGLVLVSLDLPDIPGAVLIETLRLFRPELRVICLTTPDQEVDLDVAACLSKPVNRMEFNSQLSQALGRSPAPVLLANFDEDTIARARTRYAVSGSLIEAARELSRGFVSGAGGSG
jgi:DNA-binding response OmpR family regulator